MKAKLLRTIYNRVQTGLPVLGTPAEVAARFTSSPPSPGSDADRVIALYSGLSGAAGFVLSLPGFLLMPVTLPTNLAGVAALQLHLSAAVAVMGGHDLDDPATRDRCIDCLLEKVDDSGRNTEEEEVASRTLLKLGERAVRFTLEQTTKMAGRVARRAAIRKLGLRRVPLLGGFLGGGSDAYMTAHVGRCAKATFLPGATKQAA